MSTGVTPALVHSSRTNRDASCPRLPACHGIRLLCLKGKPLWKPRKRRIPRTREVVAQSSADDFSRERQRPRQKSQRFTDPANGSGNWPPSGQRDDAFFDDEDIVDTRTPPMQNMRGRMGNGVAARDGSGKLGPGGRGGGNRYAPVQGAGVPARPGSQGGYPDGNPATTGRVPPPRLGRRTGYGMVYGGSMEEDDFFGDPSRKGGRQSEGDANDLDAPLSAEEILLLGVDVDVDSARRQAVSATSSDEMEVTKSAGSGTHQPKEEATLTSSSPSRGHMPDASGASTTDGPSSTTSRVLATPALSAAKHGSSTPTSPPVSRIIKSELTVGSMVDRIARGKLDVAPRFQRNYVWKLPAASKLVESVFMFAPIPTIFCCLGEDGQTWEVVDGKQRLTSLWSFVKGEFPDGRPFVLNGLEVLPELNDKSFQDLDDAQRETLLDYSLSVHLLPAADLDPDYVFEVFERLNMGGMQLNAQELRNCMYHGKYKDLVEELVMHPLMRDICRSPVPQPRMKDHELILRFFALLRNTPVNYRGPMKQWLNREARDFRNPSTEDVVVMRYEFTRVLKAAHRIFGENAFRVIRDDPPTTGPLPGEINPAIWDMILYTFSQYADLKGVVAKKDDVLAAFIQECRDGCLSGSLISQPTNMMERMSVWQKVMDGVMAKRDSRDDSMF
eukprot:jgi/Mesvir1/2261/Mv19308-RA.1